MKYTLLLFCCVVLVTKLPAQLVDTIIEARWNGNVFANSFRTINTYDASCNLITELDQVWDVNLKKWRNEQLYTYTYLGSKQATKLRQDWNSISHSWNNNYRVTNGYNNLKLISQLSETWRISTWKDSSRETIVYNSGKEIKTIFEIWDTLSNTWKKSAQTNFAYNSDTTIKQSVTQLWDTVTSAWNNLYKQLYWYNTNKIETHMEYQTWDTLSKIWLHQSKNIYSDSTSIFQLWQNNQWLNVERSTRTYDDNHFLVKELDETWHTNSWSNSNKTVYTNNIAGKPYQVIYKQWNAEKAQWINQTRFTYFYIPGCTFPIAITNINNKIQLALNAMHSSQ